MARLSNNQSGIHARLGSSQAAAQITLGRASEADALAGLAIEARAAKRYEASEDLLTRALQLAPRRADLWFARGTTAFQAGLLAGALEFYRQAAELDPLLGEAHLNVAAVLEQMERQREALAPAQRAIELLPENPVAHYNLGNIQRALANLPAAIRSFHRALEVDLNYLHGHWNLATCYLLQGDYIQGWEKYEWRERAGAVFFDRYAEPRWDGSSLAGKTLLVHAEQGLGDEIIFATCYPELMSQAARLIIVCEPRLEQLFARSFPRAIVYGYARKNTWEPPRIPERFDLQIPAGSVPYYLRPDLECFPRQRRLLLPHRGQLAAWQKRLAALGDGLKVGISWRAGGRTSERRRRTTEMDHWQSLFALGGVHWVNLQYGDTDEEIAAVREQCGVTIHDWPEADPLLDQDAFAAKIAALDLVISVGNATAHMAGAVGTPAWVVLPLVPGWRWKIAGAESPWYHSVRLFRQQELGDWNAPFAALERNLKARLRHAGLDDQPAPRRGTNARLSSIAAKSLTENDELDCVQDDNRLHEEVIPRVLARAIEKHRAGDLAAAEVMYRQILRRSPREASALHLLGVVAQQTGRIELALHSLRRALALVDNDATIHFNYGNALVSASRLAEAIDSYRRAVSLDPEMHQARQNLAVALQQSGRPIEAIEPCRALVAQAPHSAEAYWHLGSALRLAAQMDEATECFETCIGLDAGFVKAYNALAQLMLEDGRADEALQFCRLALQQHPGYVTAHLTMAAAQRALKRDDEAVATYRRALQFEPARFETLFNLAELLTALGHADESADLYCQALVNNPDHPATLNGLGQAFEQQDFTRPAIACFKEAARLDPAYAPAQCNLALQRLRSGDFAHGWDQYEWRWHLKGGPRQRNYFSQPAWNGESLEGKTILIHGEQGLGDEIMFATCFSDVIARAARTVLACDRRLAPLFARSFPTATVIGMVRGREHLLQLPAGMPIDMQIAAGSVPRFVRRTAESFPRAAKLLAADPAKVERWRQRLDQLGPGRKIGISWRAGMSDRSRLTRWTRLADWHRILKLDHAHFISLQHGDCEDEIRAFESTFGLRPHSFVDFDPRQNVEELAAQISALDLVISVGNANVHLAGALGVTAWSLVPRAADWLWGCAGEACLWYAGVKLLRQTTPGDWSDCFDRIELNLTQNQVLKADKT